MFARISRSRPFADIGGSFRIPAFEVHPQMAQVRLHSLDHFAQVGFGDRRIRLGGQFLHGRDDDADEEVEDGEIFPLSPGRD